MPDPDIAQYTSVFRAGQRNRIKRNRQPISCMACQRRKSKCDKGQPCGACEKRGEGAGCKYGSVASSGMEASLAQGSKAEVQFRLSKLEELVRGFASGSSSSPGIPGQVVTDSPASQLGLGNSAPVKGALISHDSPAPDSAALNYHGATSWASLVESIHDIQHLLQEDDDSEPSLSGPDTPEDADPLLGNIPPITLSEARGSLPPRSETDRVITCYFHNKFHAIPFLHTRQFRRHYEAFWANPASVGFLWISIIFSVISAGAKTAMVRYANDPALVQGVEDPRHYLHISARCLTAGRYLSGKEGSVEALLQHAHARNMQRLDADHVIWALYGLAVRLAQRQGYHRDANKVPAGAHLTPFKAEMRRRVWFMVQTSDMLFSFQTGMPPMVSEGVVDTAHPTNLLDEDFDEDSPSLPPARGDADPTPILAYIWKSRLGYILRRVMLHALAVEAPPLPETMDLNMQLDEWYAALPTCLRVRTIRETAFTDPNYTIMHRIMLELMYRKCLCVLHRPNLSSRDDDPLTVLSRNICRNAALKMLDMHIELEWEVSPEGRMYENRYMVSNLTLQHFLLASTVVCVDLSESQDLSQEERAHRKDILQRSMAIWAARGAYSADARHAARVLRAVLAKVDSSQQPTATPSASTYVFSPSTTSPETDYNGGYSKGNMPSGFGAGMAMDFGAPREQQQPQYQHYRYQQRGGAAVEGGVYSTFTPGGDDKDAQFPLNLEDAPELDSLLYSTEALNWKSIDQFLRLDNTEDCEWATMLQSM